MDSYGVKRRDTTRGPPARILSLDGGGVRGYSMFIILQELMHRTFVEMEGRAPRRHEIPKPCDHFDLIVGTGTGGLIALMLGRLRLDLETCKELYVRLTRMVFETDKTIAGIPYRHTLFKASRLEEAIRQCVREHTIDEVEGNDGSNDSELVNPLNAAQHSSAAAGPRRNMSNASVVSFSARSPSSQMQRPIFNSRGGDANARLYDARETRTKTAVAANYKGSSQGAPAVMLRSYDSRREPTPEFDCKIWEAGRATCAIGLAFKPIQIGQSVFHDDAHGTFNPAPEALDEAVLNEWPGRDVGVFVSVGTGRRPRGSEANSQSWYEGFLGEFAEARKRLIAKIEGCERIHEYMVREQLHKRGVNVENYYRLNVEIGVGEFGMNEWNRLGEISTGTRRFMARNEERKMSEGIAAKLARINSAKIRWERAAQGIPSVIKTTPSTDTNLPLAVELEGSTPVSQQQQQPLTPHSFDSRNSFASFESGQADSLHLGPPSHRPTPPPRTSLDQRPSSGSSGPSPPPPPGSGQRPAPPILSSNSSGPQPRTNGADKLMVMAPTPAQYRYASGVDKIAITSPDEQPRPMLPTAVSGQQQQHAMPPPTRMEPPPLPPKTPLPGNQRQQQGQQGQQQGYPGQQHGPGRRPANMVLPYPTDDEGPPPVNMARRPDYRGR